MPELEDFGRLLEDTIAANKLSSSKVTKVRDEAVSCMHESKGLAQAILDANLRASHKTKLSALYLLDAVARHAQDIARKGAKGASAEGIDVSNVKPPRGSQATAGTWEAARDAAKMFLKALGDVVERIAVDAVQSVPSEQREKALKVVDIWIKADTFDVHMLRDIKATVKRRQEAGSRPQEDHSEVNSMPSPYGMMVMEDREGGGENANGSTANAPPGLPSNVLALLGGASKKPAGGSPSSAHQSAAAVAAASASSSTPSFDPKQLAMLQQLAGQTPPSTSAAPAPRQPGPPPTLPGRPPVRPPAIAGPSTESYRRSPPSQMYSNPPPARREGQWQRADSGQAQRRSMSPRRGPNQGAGFEEQETNESVSGNRWGERQQQQQQRPAPVTTADLSQFDPTTFDPTDAKAWTTFAQMWNNTYGYMPSNQELLMWMMMSGMQMGGMMGSGPGSGAPASSYDGSSFDAGFQHQQSHNQKHNQGYGEQGQSYGQW
ncbi:hypothetical protein FA10DRAFT_278075 [Acaromyces ingoldii]|uniref:CID domain-containing protein n=1 Tax=Acaromyces ingoldii TaxID=215250 RepID=A0A316YPP3_9BASI|nr:hypothetical protein FA10DRAFT_278075 [Acaromyces ingoldii]PWN91201.1 hypothetical protein FA10DRAFT_278075 [Acaromyces ingoldii]